MIDIDEMNIEGNSSTKIKYLGKDLFSIAIYNKINNEDKAKIDNLISENQNYSFVLIIHDEEKFKELNLDNENIKEKFSNIN